MKQLSNTDVLKLSATLISFRQ